MIQEKFADKKTALERAQELAKTRSYVVVIFSANYYYVETTPGLLRSWEKRVWVGGKEKS